MSIDLDAAGRRRARAAARARPAAALPRRLARGGRQLPAHARRDQLRLRLVPHAAKAAGLLRLLHGGVGAGRPLPRRTARGRTEELQLLDGAARGRGARAGARPRADAALRRGAARPGPLPRRAAARSSWSQGACGSAEALARRAAPRHAVLRRPRLLEARPDRAERPGAGRRRRLLRPRPAHDLRRQPRAARAARGRRAALRARAGGADRLRRAAAARARRSGRSAPARSTPASRSRRGSACPPRVLDVWLWNRGQGPSTRRFRAIARARSSTSCERRSPGRRPPAAPTRASAPS